MPAHQKPANGVRNSRNGFREEYLGCRTNCTIARFWLPAAAIVKWDKRVSRRARAAL
jgi:hypothetical protein